MINSPLNNERQQNMNKLELIVLHWLSQLSKNTTEAVMINSVNEEPSLYIELPNRHHNHERVDNKEAYDDYTKQEEQEMYEDVAGINVDNTVKRNKKRQKQKARRNGVNKSSSFESTVSLNVSEDKKMKTLAFHKLNQSMRFTSVVKLVRICYELLSLDKYTTKRDIYYTNTELFNHTQLTVDELIDDLAALLHTSRHKLHVVASARGLVYGSLTFKERVNANQIIQVNCKNFEASGGLTITPIIERLSHFQIHSSIRSQFPPFILIVEKDAVFSRLIQDKFCDRYPCVLVTGKGYPDVATRMFWTTVMRNCPGVHCFVLTDADPHGIDIARVYKYGSQTMQFMNQDLCLSEKEEQHLLLNVHWIGLDIVSDFKTFQISDKCKIATTEFDERKIVSLLQEFDNNSSIDSSGQSFTSTTTTSFVKRRDYIQWREQLYFMKKHQVKAEIQALSSKGLMFLSQVYLPQKIVQILSRERTTANPDS